MREINVAVVQMEPAPHPPTVLSDRRHIPVGATHYLFWRVFNHTAPIRLPAPSSEAIPIHSRRDGLPFLSPGTRRMVEVGDGGGGVLVGWEGDESGVILV